MSERQHAYRPRRPERPARFAEPLPDLTPEEVAALVEAARLAKAGRIFQAVAFGRGGKLIVKGLSE